jgi:flagellar motor switch protein FliG
MVCKRLVELTSGEEGVTFEENLPRETLRKVALVLSGLTKERRDVLLSEIEENDEDTANMVKALMVTWEDIPKIENRSLQEVLRKIDEGILAKALYGADPVITEKIRSNISERAAEMVDEETSLMAEPRKKEIFEAREKVAGPLKEANEAEELAFIEEE